MSIISGQPSKFAVLAVDSSSDSEEEWTEVKGGPKTKVPVKGKVEGSGSGGNKQLSKNAKKRARKKKSQQTEVNAQGKIIRKHFHSDICRAMPVLKLARHHQSP